MLGLADLTHNNLKTIACLTGGEVPQVAFLDSAPALPVKQVFFGVRFMGNPWFRLYKEFATDPVVQSLAFEDQRHYIIILCMKCDGLIDRNIAKSARDRIILRTLGLDTNSGEEAQRRLIEVGLIDKNWQPKTWDKRQYLSDSSTERVRKYRKNKETGNVASSLQKRDCNGPEADTETEADTDTEKPTTMSSPKVNDPVPFKKIVDLYHSMLPELPKIEKLTKTREGYIRQRWKHDLPALKNWSNYFDYIRQSDFLMGKIQPRDDRPPFTPNLEWFTRPRNYTNVLEGKYHGVR